MGLSKSRALPRIESKGNSYTTSTDENIPKRKNRLFSFKIDAASKDKTKAFRELIANWKPEDVEKLYREFMALQLLYELRVDVNSTRAPVRLISEQLYRRRSSSDVSFDIEGDDFNVSRTLLSYRCDQLMFFKSDKTSKTVTVPPKHKNNPAAIKSFISFLYTDKATDHFDEVDELKEIYGCRRSLEEDLLRMEMAADTEGDFEMKFVSTLLEESDTEISPVFTMRCHSDILMGRSSYFRQLIAKWRRSDITIDEALFPHQFAHVVRFYLYTDQLDLSKIPDGIHTQSSLSEARAIVAGRNLNTSLNHSIRLVNIAKFFSLWRLVQLCEDAIVEALSVDTCVLILNWAISNRCSFVRKRAQRFVEDNFYSIAYSRHFINLEREALLDLVKSPFVQGTEVDILDAVIAWMNPDGHATLNTDSSSTSPDILEGKDDSRSSMQNGKELLQHIRPDYVLPAFDEKLNKAYKLGYIDRPPLKVLDCSSSGDVNPDSHWIYPDQQCVGPRLYFPYMKVCHNRLLSLGRRVAPVWEAWEYPTLMTRIRLSEPIQDGQCILDSARPHMQGIVAWAEKKYNFGCLIRDYHKKVAVEMLAELALNSAPLSSIEVEMSYSPPSPSPGGSSVFQHCTRDLPDLTLVPNETSSYPLKRLFSEVPSVVCEAEEMTPVEEGTSEDHNNQGTSADHINHSAVEINDKDNINPVPSAKETDL